MIRCLFILLALTQMFNLRATYDGEENPDHPSAEVVSMRLIKGIVSDAGSGEFITGAMVRVLGTDISVFTDFSGEFSIELPVDGEYNLEVECITYRRKIVIATKAENGPILIKLKSQSTPKPAGSTVSFNPKA